MNNMDPPKDEPRCPGRIGLNGGEMTTTYRVV